VAKVKTIYACQHCGSQYSKWQGQCLECQRWNTIVEETNSEPVNPKLSGYAAEAVQLAPLSTIPVEKVPRLPTGLSELDHVLGGGLVRDAVVLIGGDPGVGKSTLLLQLLTELPVELKPLYVTGEESLQQVALRSRRLGLTQDRLHLLTETHVERIIQHAKAHRPKVMVIDSIQTLFTEHVTSAPGSVSQVRESAAQLVRFAKQQGIALLIVGHVTKEGSIAGPRVLEHMVDTVLYFEGKNDTRFRMLRAVKNRFGAVNEIGVFAMTEAGLKTVSNPSAIFLSRYHQLVSGSSILVTWEGSRPLLVEVQALVDQSHLGNPRRVTVGLDHNRLAMLLAVLNRHGGIMTADQDVFVNVVGGLRVTETAADLALVLAVMSSLRDRPIPADVVMFGEIGLSGEIRPVSNGQERLREAQKLGFKRALVPQSNVPKKAPAGMTIVGCTTLAAALTALQEF
jgi:DNA repair protein RadA/Sms